MSILVSCLGCGVKLKAPDNTAGKKLACPKCKNPILVPSFQTEQPPKINTPPSEPFVTDEPPSLNDEEQEDPIVEKVNKPKKQTVLNKRLAIIKYFSPPLSGGCAAIVSIIIGLVFFLSIFGGHFIGLLLCLPFFAYGISVLKVPMDIISDKTMDAFILEDLVLAKGKALTKSSIDESQLVGEQLTIFGFADRGDVEILWKKGKDNIIRHTPITVTVITLTENQLVAYQSDLDLTTGNFLNESTDEYFYKDIVSIATKTESREIKFKNLGKIQLNEAEIFKLTTSGGTSIEVILRDRKLLIEKMGGGEIPITDVEKTISVVRKMLREKKSNS